MTKYGTFSITCLRDIGALGPEEGPPVVYEWPLAFCFVPLIPWALLAMCVALGRMRAGAATAAYVAVCASGFILIVSGWGQPLASVACIILGAIYLRRVNGVDVVDGCPESKIQNPKSETP